MSKTRTTKVMGYGNKSVFVTNGLHHKIIDFRITLGGLFKVVVTRYTKESADNFGWDKIDTYTTIINKSLDI